MNIKNICIFFLLLSMLIGTGTVIAQDNPPNFRSIQELKKNSREAKLPDHLQVARQLVRRGAYLGAVDLLEQIYLQDKDNNEVINLLLRCYTELKADHKAELLLKRRIERAPLDFGNYNRLINLYLQSGRDSLADLRIKETIEAFPGNPDVFYSLIRNLVNQNHFETALRYIKRGREQFENPNLFALDMARIYESRREYRPAVNEYFKCFSLDSATIIQAERRLSMLIRYPEAPPEVISSLLEILDSLPDDKYALKYLQEAYVKSGQFDEAFNICLTLDSLTESNGNLVFRYMRLCRDRKLYEQVIKTAEYIDQRGYEKKPYGDYRFYYAEALIGLGRYREAIPVYDEIAATYPGNLDKAEALLNIGNIYRYRIRDYDSARIYYDSLVIGVSGRSYVDRALYEIGHLLIVQGMLDSAATVFTELAGHIRRTEQLEEIDYSRAMIHFYKKDFEQANLAFRKLIAQYPRGIYVNDALINSLIISEAQLMFPDALDDYSEALFYKARMLPDSMAGEYLKIIERGQTTLTGLAIYRLSDYQVGRGDTAAALEIIAEMEKKYPEDYFYPYGLKLKGDILNSRGDTETAAKIYQTILEKYYAYPFAGEVRKFLQKLDRPPS